MVSVIGVVLGILLALGVHALHQRFCKPFPLAATILGLVLGCITTAVASAFLGPYTGELHSGIVILLLVYWGTAFLFGIYHSCIRRTSLLQTTAALILLASAALGIILLCEKLTELAFYRGAGDDPTWLLAQNILHTGEIVFLITLLLLVLIAPWLSPRKTLPGT